MLNKLPIWQQLQTHQSTFATFSLTDEFNKNPERVKQLSGKINELYVDFSKNLITNTTLQLLLELADTCQLKQKITDLFAGNRVNFSQQQPALHTHLRQPTPSSAIQHVLDKMAGMSEKIRTQQWRGFTGKVITDVVNLGTGGSYLGPYFCTQALTEFADAHIKLHFFANQQDKILQRMLTHLNPETTLVIVSSKSFTTQETLHNFNVVLAWLNQVMPNEQALHQCLAITANPDKARCYGFKEEHILTLLPTVGGRYSIWSAMGLPICINNGFDQFKKFLAGSAAMDAHFLQTPFVHNIPVLLALIDIWYRNFFAIKGLAILPYHQDLYLLPRYLQQLFMESLGKSVTQSGTPVTYQTGHTLWGGVGGTGQHAYHQLFHQGTEFIPCDFIVTLDEPYLFAQCLAQSRALMVGQDHPIPAQFCPGNRPSTTLVFPELNAYNLGLLLALYEHRVFTQAAIWDINAFDQWGVELGKNLGQAVEDAVKYQQLPVDWDSSTKTLLTEYFNRNK